MVITIFEKVDLSILVILFVALSFYLFKNRKRLHTDGALLLYKTQWGVKLIEKIGDKYKKTLNFLSYVSIVVGYFLMAGILYLLGNTLWNYLTNPLIVQAIKAPPIAPLIPYFPKLFGMQSFFPEFYAIYFILAILIVATVHEFSHGIFARRYKIKIKSTGFAFLKFFPAIFGAFVEQDDKQMEKAKKKEQLAILSAGVFANFIFGIIFFFVLILFFNLAFAQSGAVFQDYVYSAVPISAISFIDGKNVSNLDYNSFVKVLNQSFDKGLIEIRAGNKNFSGVKGFFRDDEEKVLLYESLPAINSGLNGVVVKINDAEIKNFKDFRNNLLGFSSGENITIANDAGEIFEITLAKKENSDLPYLGVANLQETNFVVGELSHYLSSLQRQNLYFKENTFYTEKFSGAEFIYYLFWWIVLINILVAFFNMLPVSILDGGRFFYLTIWGLTKSEKTAKRSFKIITYLILLVFIVLMIKWATRFF